MAILKEQLTQPQSSTLTLAELIEKIVACAKESGLEVAKIDNEKAEVILGANFKLFDMGLWRCYASKVLVEIHREVTGDKSTVTVYGLPNLFMLKPKGPDNYDAVQAFMGSLSTTIVQ